MSRNLDAGHALYRYVLTFTYIKSWILRALTSLPLRQGVHAQDITCLYPVLVAQQVVALRHHKPARGSEDSCNLDALFWKRRHVERSWTTGLPFWLWLNAQDFLRLYPVLNVQEMVAVRYHTSASRNRGP